MSPCVSVIIPAYNAARVVRETLEMLRVQTFGDFEVIVVDDGSSDETASIVGAFAEADGRFRLISQNNAGAAAARNTGLALAQGTYVCFLDADDIYDEQLLQLMVAALVETGCDLCVSEADIYHMETGETKALFRFREDLSEGAHDTASFGRRLFQSFNKTPWNKLYRRDFLMRTGIAFQSLPNMNDTFFVECNLALAERVFVLKKNLVAYRRGLGTSLQDTRVKHPACALSAASALFDELQGRSVLDAERLISLKNECWRLAQTAVECALIPKDREVVADVLAQARGLASAWKLDELRRADFALIEYWFFYVCYMRVSVGGLMWAYDIKRKPIFERQSLSTNIRTAIRLGVATILSPDRSLKGRR